MYIKGSKWIRRGGRFIALSLAIHALFVLFMRSSPEPEPRLFLSTRGTFFDPFKRYAAKRPTEAVQPMQRLGTEGPDAVAVEDFAAEQVVPIDPVAPAEWPTIADSLLNVRKDVFRAERVAEVDLDSLSLAAEVRRRAALEAFARLYMADVDTTDAESEARRRARQIVERAIAVMGGHARLSAMHSLRLRAWVEAWEHVVDYPPPARIMPIGQYVYPVVEWDYGFSRDATAHFSARPIQIDRSDPLLERNPAISLRRFAQLFQYRWLFLKESARALRLDGEVERWHFLDRFLGYGIVLHYVGQEPFAGQQAEVVRVDDRRYGHLLEAYFARASGLLLGVREGLTDGEAQAYRAQYQKRSPSWTTTYEKYKRVCGVLEPHRISRSGPACAHCYGREQPDIQISVQLQIACNEDAFDEQPPTLESWVP